MNARSIEVLLIEDDPTDVLLTREILKDARQFHLQHAERLGRALDLLSAGRFDVVLLDLGLPDSQGLDTLLRVREGSPHMPVVVMTSRDDEELALRAVQEGAQDYLVKTYVHEGVLTRAIRYAIERNQTATALREGAALASFNADVGLAFTKGGSMREMLRLCAESMVRNLDAAFARVWTLSESGAELELQASAGMYTRLDGSHSRIAVGQLKIGLIAEERKPHLTNDVANDPRVSDPEWARREGMVAFAGYPLLVENRLVGVMALFAKKALTQTVLQAMASVANHIALGIERKRTDDTLHDVNRMLESLLDTAPLAIIVIDPDARVLRWNAAAERLFGWTEEEVLGRPLPYVPQDLQEAMRSNLMSEFQAGRASEGAEWHFRRRDGSPVDVALWTAAIRDDWGNIVAAMGLLADRTAQKRLEEQFRQAQKMEAVGSLAGGVAHDFNNHLTVIGGYSDLIQRRLPPNSPLQELVGEIIQAGSRAASLTRQLLAFSRKQVLEPKVLNLNDLVADLEKMLTRLIGEDVVLKSALEPSLGSVKADAGQMEQVLMNLVVNARDAMPRGGRLTIETRNEELDESYTRAFPELTPGRYVLIAVSDTGTGMDDATRSRIFEPFFTTKGVGKGTGLGLSTVYGIVKQSAGHVAVYSEPGRGSTFKVYLPRVDGAAVARATAPSSTGVVGSETVLLAEDDAALRELTRRILEMHGYTVLGAGNGEEALRVAADYGDDIHLVVTDVVMPEMSGSELAARLSTVRPGVKVLYLSGYTDDAVVRHGVLDAGAAFLQKPFSPTALAAKVREILDAS